MSSSTTINSVCAFDTNSPFNCSNVQSPDPTLTDASKIFTAVKRPNFTFSEHGIIVGGKQTGISNWTNTDPQKNGGTHIQASNINTTALSASTITISLDLHILKWGTRDVTMTLDLDDIVTHNHT